MRILASITEGAAIDRILAHFRCAREVAPAPHPTLGLRPRRRGAAPEIRRDPASAGTPGAFGVLVGGGDARSGHRARRGRRNPATGREAARAPRGGRPPACSRQAIVRPSGHTEIEIPIPEEHLADVPTGRSRTSSCVARPVRGVPRPRLLTDELALDLADSGLAAALKGAITKDSTPGQARMQLQRLSVRHPCVGWRIGNPTCNMEAPQ